MCPVKVEAFILIGGRSTRFGRDKAFVKVGVKTLADRALTTVRESGIASKVFFVAGNEAQFAIEAARLEAPFIFDIIEERGPLGGLHAALSNANSDWILLLACDYPLITPALLQILHGNVSIEFGVVLPEQMDGRLQPLCAFYQVKVALPAVNEIIQRPRTSPPMYEIAAELAPRIVKAPEYKSSIAQSEAYFTNINTEEDLEFVRKNQRKLLGRREI